MLSRKSHGITVQRVLRILTLLGFVFLLSDVFLLWNFRGSLQPTFTTRLTMYESHIIRAHPIERLVLDASSDFSDLLGGCTHDLRAAADSYRQARGRHPPPGFDAWYEFARTHDAVIVESFFDQIYRDLTPFWGIPATDMRNFARSFDYRIYVRNGTANIIANHAQGTARDRMDAWFEVVQSLETMLPDLDMAINIMDESRVIVPWEDMEKIIRREIETRALLPEDKIQSQYMTFDQVNDSADESFPVTWIGPVAEAYWDIARVGCALESPGRYKAAANDFTGPPLIPTGYPMRSLDGYVRNWTYVRDPCQQRYIQEAHGTFIEPTSISTTRQLIPIFGESKLSMNNDILVPPAAYLSDSFSSGSYSDANAHGGNWSDKVKGVIWRGVASGGRNREENWTRFHRHRFVSMMNGSYVRDMETSPDAIGEGRNFVIQSYAKYHLLATKSRDLGNWLETITNVGFTKLLCWPSTENSSCNYTEPYFRVTPPVEMSKQYDYKMLPDLDGNSFSGRYLSFLRSTSVPIKATIYSEWHDDRLVPWLHFIPMDNSFVDVYDILDYFIGDGGGERWLEEMRDEAAERIALSGKEWAEKVLRKEDMKIYMLRLLLEYARLCDDNRDTLGYVGDLG